MNPKKKGLKGEEKLNVFKHSGMRISKLAKEQFNRAASRGAAVQFHSAHRQRRIEAGHQTHTVVNVLQYCTSTMLLL